MCGILFLSFYTSASVKHDHKTAVASGFACAFHGCWSTDSVVCVDSSWRSLVFSCGTQLFAILMSANWYPWHWMKVISCMEATALQFIDDMLRQNLKSVHVPIRWLENTSAKSFELVVTGWKHSPHRIKHMLCLLCLFWHPHWMCILPFSVHYSLILS